MGGKVDRYRGQLRALPDGDAWESFLLEESALPGPRANLELVYATIEEGTRARFLALIESAPEAGVKAQVAGDPVDPRREFLAVCGAAGLGRMLAKGDVSVLPVLRALAGDPRWRVREGVAMALQRWGDDDMSALLETMREWSGGTRFEQRAVVAGLCEPRLLSAPEVVRSVLVLLDAITATLLAARDRRDEGFKALRKALAYGWSVAVVAELAAGLPLLEHWLTVDDPDVSWVMRQNLGKARLRRSASEWVEAWRERL